MTNKTKKRSLLLSVLSLLLCMGMLIGTTFAWFTDTAVTGVNTIQSGKLDVVLEYSVDDGATWQDAEGITLNFMDLDDNKLWEPGCTYNMPLLRVRNAGNLALKYQIAISGLIGDAQLLEAIEWTVNGEALVDTYTGTLTAGEAGEALQITGHMLETAGNEYMDLKIENIAIAVYATQMTAENDSFGPNYDYDAWHPEMKVYTEQDLVAALANGESVVLMNDIEADNTIILSGNAIIDLNGNTLTANLAVTEDATIVIENGKIDSASPANSAIESVGNLTLNDVEVESDRHAVRVEGGVTVINGGYYVAADYAGRTQHAVNVSDGGKVIINGGTFIGPKGTASDSGSAVKVQADSEVVINDGNFSGGKTKTLDSKGTLTVYGGTFDQDPSAYLTDDCKATKCDDVWMVTAEGIYPATPSNVQTVVKDAPADAVVLLTAGEYHDTIVMKSGITLLGSEGAVVDCIALNAASDVTLKNIEFNAAGAQTSYDNNGTAKTRANIVSWNAKGTGYKANNIVIDGCTFTGAFVNDGAAIAFTDQGRGGESNITIKGCTFDTTNGVYDIYGHYFGGGAMTIEDNTFASVSNYPTYPTCIYLGRYQSSTPVVVKGNTFEHKASFDAAAYVQDHSSYGVSFAESENIFNG